MPIREFDIPQTIDVKEREKNKIFYHPFLAFQHAGLVINSLFLFKDISILHSPHKLSVIY